MSCVESLFFRGPALSLFATWVSRMEFGPLGNLFTIKSSGDEGELVVGFFGVGIRGAFMKKLFPRKLLTEIKK